MTADRANSPPLVTVIPLGGGVEPHARLQRSLQHQTMPRWVLADPKEGKLAAAWINRAVQQASTPYVFFAAADAELAPTLLEKAFWFLATHPRYAFVNSHEGRRRGPDAVSPFTGCFYDRDAVLRADKIGLHVMARRESFLALNGLDAAIDQGACVWEFWLRAAQAGQWGSTIPEPLITRPTGVDLGDSDQAAVAKLRPQFEARFPRLFAGHVPAIEPRWPKAFEPVREQLPATWSVPRSAAGTRRMLMIVPWLRMGGADKFNLDCCEILRRHGWELTIACSAPGPNEWQPHFERHTRDLFFPHHFLHWADYPVLVRSLIDSRRPDVVFISNSEFAYHMVPYLRAYHPEPAYVDYVHMEEEEWKSGGHARHSAGLHDQLDLTLVTSEHLRTWLTDRGASPDRVVNCPIGVDASHWKSDAAARRAVRQELGVDDDTPVILHAGRICPQKQPAVLARTIQALAQSGRAFKIWIAGSGEDLPWLERFVAEHGLAERVRFLGEVSPDRSRQLMAAADIFFLPSKWEGVALVLYEAMATGTVFVGADVGGQREVAPPETAILVKPDVSADAATQASRYVELLEPLLADRARRQAIAAAARRRVEEKYTLRNLEQTLMQSLDRAMMLRVSQPRQRLSPGLGQEMAVRGIEFVRSEWQLGQLWKEREYWRTAATAQTVESQRPPEQGRSALRRVLRALRPGSTGHSQGGKPAGGQA